MQVEVAREGSFDQITGELVSSREAEAAIGLPCLGMKAENFMAMAIRLELCMLDSWKSVVYI